MSENNDPDGKDKLVNVYSEFEDEFEDEYQKTRISPLDVLKKFEKELLKNEIPYCIRKNKFTKIAFFDYYSGAYF